jgi:thiol-disulfide isomerase/thioredoxin
MRHVIIALLGALLAGCASQSSFDLGTSTAAAPAAVPTEPAPKSAAATEPTPAATSAAPKKEARKKEAKKKQVASKPAGPKRVASVAPARSHTATSHAPSGPPAGSTAVASTSTKSINRDVAGASHHEPVFVTFCAPWAVFCHLIEPRIRKAVRPLSSKAKMVFVDIQKDKAMANKYGVKAVPTVIAFVDGKPVDRFVGAKPEMEITVFLKRVIKKRALHRLGPAGANTKS